MPGQGIAVLHNLDRMGASLSVVAMGVDHPGARDVCRGTFLIPATLMAHAFWQVADTSLYPVQLINFFKNVCMAGGLVFIAAVRDQPVLLPRSTWLTRMYTVLLDQLGVGR